MRLLPLTLLTCWSLLLPGNAFCLNTNIDEIIGKAQLLGYKNLSLKEYRKLGCHCLDSYKPYSAALFYKLGIENISSQIREAMRTHQVNSLPADDFAKYIRSMGSFAKPFLRTVISLTEPDIILFCSDPMKRTRKLEAEGLFPWIDNHYERSCKIVTLCKSVFDNEAQVCLVYELTSKTSKTELVRLLDNDTLIIDLAAVEAFARIKSLWIMAHEQPDAFYKHTRKIVSDQLYGLSLQWANEFFEDSETRHIKGYEKLIRVLLVAEHEKLPYCRSNASMHLAKMKGVIDTF